MFTPVEPLWDLYNLDAIRLGILPVQRLTAVDALVRVMLPQHADIGPRIRGVHVLHAQAVPLASFRFLFSFALKPLLAS